MNLTEAQRIAQIVKSELSPHCERIEIAGSIRRGKPEVKDIEIVAIPKPYDVGLFASDYSHHILATGWVKKGYHSREGYLNFTGTRVQTPEETDIFRAIGIPFVDPSKRELYI